MSMPLGFLALWLAGLLSLALLGVGAYLVWAWWVGEIVEAIWLAVGVALLLWSVAGRSLVLLFRRRGGRGLRRAVPRARRARGRPPSPGGTRESLILSCCGRRTLREGNAGPPLDCSGRGARARRIDMARRCRLRAGSRPHRAAAWGGGSTRPRA